MNINNVCCDNARRVAQFAENFKPGELSFLASGNEEKWYGSLINKPDGEWNSTAWKMVH